MTKSKCFKLLMNFAFLMTVFALGASAYAQPRFDYEQKLILQKDDSIKVVCPQGGIPTLQGNTISCSSTCKLEIVNTVGDDFQHCDQGGCPQMVVSFKITLTQTNGATVEPVLYVGSFDIARKADVVTQVKAGFSESCKLIQVSERGE